MNEKVQWKGQLAELKGRYNTLKFEGQGLLILLRSLLNPFEPDLTRLQVEIIENNADRLKTVVQQMREAKAQIEKLQEALGETNG